MLYFQHKLSALFGRKYFNWDRRWKVKSLEANRSNFFRDIFLFSREIFDFIFMIRSDPDSLEYIQNNKQDLIPIWKQTTITIKKTKENQL